MGIEGIEQTFGIASLFRILIDVKILNLWVNVQAYTAGQDMCGTQAD